MLAGHLIAYLPPSILMADGDETRWEIESIPEQSGDDDSASGDDDSATP